MSVGTVALLVLLLRLSHFIDGAGCTALTETPQHHHRASTQQLSSMVGACWVLYSHHARQGVHSFSRECEIPALKNQNVITICTSNKWNERT